MAILFVPGFMTDHTLWDNCIEAFEPYGPIQHVDTSIGKSVEEIASRALRCAPAEFVLVGFSFGGYVAREMARIAPKRVQALVLVATSTRSSGPTHDRFGQAGTETIRSTFSGLSRRSIESALHPEHADESTVERIRLMGARLGADVFVRQSMTQRISDADRLAEIGCPTLVIASSNDGLRTLQEAREMYEGIRNAEFCVIEGSGHMIPIEAPQALVTAVLQWMRKQGLGQSSN